MPFTPDQPYPKTQGDNIRSKDWNDAVEEIKRLDTAKLNLVGGGNITGPLNVSANVGVGTTAPAFALQVGDPGSVGSLKLGVTGRGSTGNWRQWTLRTGDGSNAADIHKLRIRDEQAGADRFVIDDAGNVGLGTTDPRCRLDVSGAANVWADNRYAVPNNFMAPGSLTIGSTNRNYGGGWMWNANTAGLLLEALDNTEIAVHDSGNRITSLMYYEGAGADRLTIGRDMGWGPLDKLHIAARVGIGAATPAARLSVGSDSTDVYATDVWVERNIHVQGNETLAQGGRGRLRVGTAWSHVGIYADVTSTGAANDLVLGGSSGVVRIGPASGGQRIVMKDWSISVEGNDLFFKRGAQTIARISADWDRFMVFQNLDGKPPYFYFNQAGVFGLYKP
jgi:hypothetical protein